MKPENKQITRKYERSRAQGISKSVYTSNYTQVNSHKVAETTLAAESTTPGCVGQNCNRLHSVSESTSAFDSSLFAATHRRWYAAGGDADSN